jgi:Mrp family chromosome partitioning ATPase
MHDDGGGTSRFSYSSMPGFLPAADAAKFAASSLGFGAAAAAGVSPGRGRMRSTAAAAAAGDPACCGDAAQLDDNDAAELQQLHDSNVAHFMAVFSSLPEFGESDWLQLLARWLSEQSPRVLAADGVAVPRDIVKAIPEYGEYGLCWI